VKREILTYAQGEKSVHTSVSSWPGAELAARW
jgi:hypothetical protein